MMDREQFGSDANVVSLKVDRKKIGAIIGSGGKNIKEIVRLTGTKIDVKDDGSVKVIGEAGPKMDKAVLWVKTLAGEIEKGMQFQGKIKKILEFGIFVELVPGKDGLLHISSIPKEHQEQMDLYYQIGAPLNVAIENYDKFTGRIKLRFS
ncbi:MAG: Polyribonucleotide nucleotidyltransferase [candidate division TM6 bacterium GW2011_GWF2_32_72]|nr:MAG: Polyribonucleotide nucleotidyltransferase [candidate division TM6 bacterium GW2011_GWF2_32_72]